jgi:hypothetical protein
MLLYILTKWNFLLNDLHSYFLSTCYVTKPHSRLCQERTSSLPPLYRKVGLYYIIGGTLSRAGELVSFHRPLRVGFVSNDVPLQGFLFSLIGVIPPFILNFTQWYIYHRNWNDVNNWHLTGSLNTTLNAWPLLRPLRFVVHHATSCYSKTYLNRTPYIPESWTNGK